ncbi:hypothetical protein C8J56DRAFT_484812 [Mycena floridula]|nr:hypothetical protein C8J56DRAFT_484812 [Mycena floridula]
MAAPPQYLNLQSMRNSGDSAPPAYSGARPTIRQTVEHIYQLTKKTGAWATLRVSSSAQKPSHMPIYVENDPIQGTLFLDLDEEDHIMAIKVLVKGQILSSSPRNGHLSVETGLVFVEDTKILWSKEMGDPRAPSSQPSRYSGKLSGRYSWPFRFVLPSTITLSSSGSPGSHGPFRLPESFLERDSQTTIQYELEAHILRSRFRVNSKLGTMFRHIPCIRPPASSPLRQLAYQENSPLLPPEADSEGWELLAPFTVRGTIFNVREVDVRCRVSRATLEAVDQSDMNQFYLAKPLSYTRGTPIPMTLQISSSDSQALDLLSTPRSVSVHLRRRKIVNRDASYLSRPSTSKLTKEYQIEAGAIKDQDDIINQAVWWSTNFGEMQAGCRTLSGEILLPGTITSSSHIGPFAIEYQVIVLPFQTPGFKPAVDGPKLQQTVEVATLFGRGPRPRAYAPPPYLSSGTISDNYSIPPAHVFI